MQEGGSRQVHRGVQLQLQAAGADPEQARAPVQARLQPGERDTWPGLDAPSLPSPPPFLPTPQVRLTAVPCSASRSWETGPCCPTVPHVCSARHSAGGVSPIPQPEPAAELLQVQGHRPGRLRRPGLRLGEDVVMGSAGHSGRPRGARQALSLAVQGACGQGPGIVHLRQPLPGPHRGHSLLSRNVTDRNAHGPEASAPRGDGGSRGRGSDARRLSDARRAAAFEAFGSFLVRRKRDVRALSIGGRAEGRSKAFFRQRIPTPQLFGEYGGSYYWVLV